jgi:hypothetical protein
MQTEEEEELNPIALASRPANAVKHAVPPKTTVEEALEKAKPLKEKPKAPKPAANPVALVTAPQAAKEEAIRESVEATIRGDVEAATAALERAKSIAKASAAPPPPDHVTAADISPIAAAAGCTPENIYQDGPPRRRAWWNPLRWVANALGATILAALAVVIAAVGGAMMTTTPKVKVTNITEVTQDKHLDKGFISGLLWRMDKSKVTVIKTETDLSGPEPVVNTSVKAVRSNGETSQYDVKTKTWRLEPPKK